MVGQLVPLCVCVSHTMLWKKESKGDIYIYIHIYEGTPFIYIYRVVIKDSDKDGW